MTYDHQEIKMRVKRERKKFLLSVFIIGLIMISTLLIIQKSTNNKLRFSCVMIDLFLLYALYYICNKHKPGILFSREKKGVNIKEDEYIICQNPGLGLGWRQVGGHAGPQPFAPNTGANRKRVRPNRRSMVYLRLENGDVTVISDLYKEHTDVFIEGDLLLKFSGTKYPIVINRLVNKQPCPICGVVNDSSMDSCDLCGLAIIKN